MFVVWIAFGLVENMGDIYRTEYRNMKGWEKKTCGVYFDTGNQHECGLRDGRGEFMKDEVLEVAADWMGLEGKWR